MSALPQPFVTERLNWSAASTVPAGVAVGLLAVGVLAGVAVAVGVAVVLGVGVVTGVAVAVGVGGGGLALVVNSYAPMSTAGPTGTLMPA